MFRSRSWFGGGLWKPKNPHSLEHLKYLYNVLSKNQTVSESNRSLLVETLRSIAEILIWGDQNDSSVFDFFLEKNMLSFFLRIMKQKCGSYVCVQLLQTLNILFENIRNETSLYYLLSNNHVNSIIEHKFDFSDEEVMAYYISFLKTLSLKLNKHTIHFFYNEHTNDFPLYTEAIKFFNNSESMVRIAVRTLTLNVYRVDDKSMQKFIRDKTAAPYFSNLVWFIGNHVLELDGCIRENSEHEARSRLADLVAEHLDHLHYVNDILLLQIDELNEVLGDHLLHRLLLPLYVSSMDKNFVVSERKQPPKVSSTLALFLLSQVFLIIYHSPLVRMLASIIIQENEIVFSSLNRSSSGTSTNTLDNCSDTPATFGISDRPENSSSYTNPQSPSSPPQQETSNEMLSVEEGGKVPGKVLSHRPFLRAIFDSLTCTENDYSAFFALCLLESLKQNRGISAELFNNLFHDTSAVPEEGQFLKVYNDTLIEKLIAIVSQTVKPDSKVRVITLTLAVNLLQKIVVTENGEGESILKDQHLALIEGAREENILVLQNYYKCDEMFLELFEDEYLDMSKARVLSTEHLLMDSNLLLPPAGSPLSGIAFDKRLPCGEAERSRRSMRVYFILRKLSLKLRKEVEKYLPLTNTQTCVHVDDNLDLTNSDLLACTVISRDSVKTRRFLVIDIFQFILVEPSQKRMGWGVVKFVGFLQDIEVMGDQQDSRCLHITVKSSPTQQRTRTPILAAKFMFDDHIRCMAAKQRLVKGRQKARERKLHLIGKLLDQIRSSPSPPQNIRRMQRRAMTRGDRPLFVPISKALPGLAMVVNESSRNDKGRRKSREPSPAVLNRSREEEIPLGNIKGKSSSSRNSSSNSSTSVQNNEVNGPPHSSSNSTNPSSSSSAAKDYHHIAMPSSQASASSSSKLTLDLNSVVDGTAQLTTTTAAASSHSSEANITGSNHHSHQQQEQQRQSSKDEVTTPQIETSFISDLANNSSSDNGLVGIGSSHSSSNNMSVAGDSTSTTSGPDSKLESSDSSSSNNGTTTTSNSNTFVPKAKRKGIIEHV